jgi:hypothetical protein
MTRAIMRTALHVPVAMLIFMMPGCASVESSYRQTREADTIAAWRAFLREHPRSEYASPARARLAELEELERVKAEVQERGAWNAAQEGRTVESYWAYLKEYPAGPRHQEALRALDAAIKRKIDDVVRGDRKLIRPGSEFPVTEFPIEELVDAMGDVYAGRSAQRKLQGDVVVEVHAMQSWRMLSPVSKEQSGRLWFLNTIRRDLILSRSARLVRGETVESRTWISGNGYAFVTLAGKTTVYDFSRK